ncbi:F-box protein [Sesbania bispinosa]|nr:F-box protein [Sesbania bispinosa]
MSRVVETKTRFGWFRCSPFRVDFFYPNDSVKTVTEYPRGEKACENLGKELRLSWIVMDPKGRHAVNVSSGKVAIIWRHWLSGKVQVRFTTVIGIRIRK